ncbi:MAG: hypothetical protein GX329_00565 [Tissierellia bacterium]|nr:hypothetical protein [Tissierellia bacterium]
MGRWSIGLIILLMILGVYSIGCKAQDRHLGDMMDGDEYPAEEVREPIYDDAEDIMDEFDNIVKGDNEPFVLIGFMDEHIGSVAEDEAVEMILELERVQEAYVERYAEQLFAEGYQMELLGLHEVSRIDDDMDETHILKQLYFDAEGIERIKDGDLEQLVQHIMDGGYKLINTEGVFYPIIDYEALGIYYEYITEEIEDYIEIKAMDLREPAIIDAELQITFDQLSGRLMDIENYIAEYPRGRRYGRLLDLYDSYLGVYLIGTDNSPIYDYETGRIREEVWDSYRKAAGDMDRPIFQTIDRYMDIIGKNGNSIDGDILSKVPGLKAMAIAKLQK